MYSTPAETVNIGIHYLGHSLAGHMVEYLMVDHMRAKHLSSVHPSFALPVRVDKAHPDAPLARARQTLNSFTAPNVSIYFHDDAAAASNLCFACVVSAGDDWRWFLPSTSAQPCTNLHTCLHDACICVKPYICLLLLIPSSGNVITPLASQTPPESKCVFCAYMYLWIWRGERNNISPLGGEEMCGFSVCSRVHSDFTHTWATISVLLTQTQAVDTPIMHSALPAGNVAALILEFCSLFIYYFFSQMKY